MRRKNNVFFKYVPSFLLFFLFELVAITLWIAKDNLFYLLNFNYIGGCLALGTVLFLCECNGLAKYEIGGKECQ